MSNTVLPLDDLAQHVARQQSDLEALRKDLHLRQQQLKELIKRKEKLAAQLQKVDADIAAVTGNVKPASAATTAATKPAPRSVSVRSSNESGPGIIDVVVAILRAQSKPLKIQVLTMHVLTTKFHTKSQNIPGLVKSTVKRLQSKGWLRRAKNKQGVYLTTAGRTAPDSTKTTATNQNGAVIKKSGVQKPTKPSTTSDKQPQSLSAKTDPQPSLRSLLTRYLRKSQRPVPLQELVNRVTATGYKSESQNFPKLVQVALSKMPDVKHVPQKGYCLSKA